MSIANQKFYKENAANLAKQYDSVSFESVHNDWLEFIPLSGNALDIGAGSGRDARFLASIGLKVYAVEPELSLLDIASKNSSLDNISWHQDALPFLPQISSYDVNFDLILLSAVWMHLTNSEREQTIGLLASLLKPKGVLIITLRHGEFSDGRVSIPCSVEEIKILCLKHKLSIVLDTPLSSDELGRPDVEWQTVVIEK